MATKPAETLGLRLVGEPVSPIASRVTTADLARIASLATSESPTRWGWILPGVIAVFALLIGVNYWISERGRGPVAVQVVRQTKTLGLARAAMAPAPVDNPAPRLASGLWQSSRLPQPEDVRASTDAQPQTSTDEQAPAPTQLQQPAPAPRYITVSDGQSLIRIARANHVLPRALAAANHLEPPYQLKVGSQLLIPDPESPSPGQ